MESNEIKIYQLDDNKFQVYHDNCVDTMNLDEVMVLLSTPTQKGELEKEEQILQMQLEEFWNSEPVYPNE